jgi:hypothetical protein
MLADSWAMAISVAVPFGVWMRSEQDWSITISGSSLDGLRMGVYGKKYLYDK